MSERGVSATDRWLLLVHQLPAKPAYLRVKVWRRLQGIGAVPVKHGVYALPNGDQTQEDFAWLMREIVEGGGEAMVCEARLVDGLSDAEVRARFDAARDAAYEEVANEARLLAKTLKAKSADRITAMRPQVAKLRARLEQIAAIDFFGAAGREPSEGLIAALEARLSPEERPVSAAASSSALKGRVWVTRQGVQIDRIASAWLIRRFIDPEAKLKFVSGRGYTPRPGELRFDMFEAEYTHEGDRCTFEVLMARCGLRDPALAAIAEIVHDIDLKDAKYGREEASGIARLIAGIAMATADDNQRIARGMEAFDSLYAYFRQAREK
ncbi:MAG TPA: chromate resistance protein ChrB domain-containing protein [Alphaproteobacteria bacterium]|nr:chromate resistance protein ChrB domain-containing protein [Alphaproteobacteria bacterium]